MSTLCTLTTSPPITFLLRFPFTRTHALTLFSFMASSPPSPGGVVTPPLQRAAYLGKLQQLKRLVKQVEKEHKGEKIGVVLGKLMDGNGCTVLHMGAVNGKTQICKYLIKDLKVNVDVRDAHDSTPLHQAILRDCYSTAVYLLENGANPNAACIKGFTPLHFAATKGFKKLVKLLISRGSDINAVCHEGTPLQIVAGAGKVDCVKNLLDNQANPNAFPRPTETCHIMFSPLVGAIYANSIECVKLLLQAGADPNIGSPLEIALGEKNTEYIKCLLAAGANPNTRNGFDLTPIELAAIEGWHAIVLLFPATAPIAEITDWSPGGIMNYVHTDEATSKRAKKREEVFLQTKSEGEAAFMRKDFSDAACHYTKCSLMDPSDATALSNRSLCWAMMNVGPQALSDAQACRSLSPDWPEAYYREGVAWKLLKDYNRAANLFWAGWQLDPQNKELESAFMEALELQVKSTELSGGEA